MAKPQKAKVQKVPVSERALVQRVNRKLKADDKKLHTARDYRDGARRYENTNMGRYYIINLNSNSVAELHADLEWWGRKLGVLRDWEELKAD